MARAWTAALGLAAAMLAGVLASGAATATTPYIGVDVEVTVWRALDDGGELYVGARDEGGLWRRHPAALDLSATSASGRFHRSEAVALTVPLEGFGEVVVEAVVWRSVADPTRLHLSVRREGERWRTVNEPLTMRAYEPYYSWNQIQRAEPVVVTVPRPDPPPVATATGPLVVFTIVSATVLWRDEDGWRLAEDVYVLDTAKDRYWRAATRWPDWGGERGGVLLAGEGLIVWDEQQARRVGLDGREEAVLYEGKTLSDLSVSPDGSKVAILVSKTLIVLDSTTGALLHHLYLPRSLSESLPDATNSAYALAGWNAASDRIAFAASARSPAEETRMAILAPNGTVHALPPNAGYLSPDFRYAIQPHDGGNGNFRLSRFPYDPYWSWGWVWSGFDVFETASGRVVRTVTATDDTFTMPHGPSFQPRWQWPGWWPGSDRFSWFEMRRRVPGECGYDFREQPPAEGSVTAASDCISAMEIVLTDITWWKESVGVTYSAPAARTLDIASGAIGQPSPDEWYGLRMDGTRLTTQGSCERYASGQACSLILNGRPVWNGTVTAVGVVDPDGPLTLRGVRPRDIPRLPDPPAPPARAEIIGPLFAWSVAGSHEMSVDTAGNDRFHPIRRVMVRDEGTGRSWRVFDYRLRGGLVWPAPGGFVSRNGTLRYVALTGQARPLPIAIRGAHISPSGRHVLVSTRAAGLIEVTLTLFALPPGEEILRVDSSEPRFDDALREAREYADDSDYVPADALVPLAWSADETAITVGLGNHWKDRPDAVLGFDGGFAILPDSPPEAHLSPDFRYYVPAGRGTIAQSSWMWDAIDIVEVASGQTVRTVPVRDLSGAAVGFSGWSWTRDGRFVWGSPGLQFRAGRIIAGDDGVVWLLDVETGATERLTAQEYAARLPAPDSERASVQCPGNADPIQWCDVLLDGKVVGEGRWAEAIGFVALD